MKKNASISMTLIIAMLMASCSDGSQLSSIVPEKVENYLNEKIMESSGITDTQEYQTWVELEKDGLLNQSGEYKELDIMKEELAAQAPQEAPNGSVCVSFAQNRFFNIEYYSDAERTINLGKEKAYLFPGDSIYVNAEVQNPNSDHYDLSEYRIVGDVESSVIKAELVDKNAGLLYTIPSGYEGDIITIIPVGQYTSRSLRLMVYMVNDQDENIELRNVGQWSINGERCSATPSIEATDSYVVQYELEADKYFYVGADPEPFAYNPNETNIVRFPEMKPTQSVDLVAIEVHPYLNISFSFDQKADVIKNDTTKQSVKKGKVWNDGLLKYGDHIIIETKGNVTIIDGDYTHIVAEKTELPEGVYRYKLYVQKEHEDDMAPNLSTVMNVLRNVDVKLSPTGKYGTCRYWIDGKEVSPGWVRVKEGQIITIRYQLTDPAAHFSDSWTSSWGEYDLDRQKRENIDVTFALDGSVISPDSYFEIRSDQQ